MDSGAVTGAGAGHAPQCGAAAAHQPGVSLSCVCVCVLWRLGIGKLPIKTTTMRLETKMINQMLV